MDRVVELYKLAAFVSKDIDAPSNITIVAASQLIDNYHAVISPEATVIVIKVAVDSMIDSVLRVLLTVYPKYHQLHWLNFEDDDVAQAMIDLDDLSQLKGKAKHVSLIIPSLGQRTSFDGFQELIAHLRSPEGCPWDREQTHQSLRPNLLEETYETLAAIDHDDRAEMQEEFGDLLLQVVLHTQIASEAGEFNMTDVINGIYTKLVDRHPHVFAELEIADAEGVKKNWEKIKAQERKAKGEQGKGLLDGIPADLPALSQADAYSKRAARVGFDWPEISGVLDKIAEEITEVQKSQSGDEELEEIGDLLFALANFARWKNIDPESALRKTNLKFRKRFAYIEQNAREQGKVVSDFTLDEMEAYWQAAKQISD